MTIDQLILYVLGGLNDNIYDRDKSVQNYTKLIALEDIAAENGGKTDIEVDEKTVEEKANALSNNKYFKSYIEKTTSDQMRTSANKGGKASYDEWKQYEHQQRLLRDPGYKDEMEDKAKLDNAKSLLNDEEKFAKLSVDAKVDTLKTYLNYSLPREQRIQFGNNLSNKGGQLLEELVKTSESAKECLDVINNEKDVNVQQVLFGGIKPGNKVLKWAEANDAEESFAEERGKIVEERKIKGTETDVLRTKRDSIYDQIESSDLYKATVMSKAEQAKEMLKQLDEIDQHKAQTRDKNKENSQSYKDMRKALEAVAAFADMKPENITKENVDNAFDGLKRSGKAYESAHTGITNLFRNNFGYGAERLAFSRGLDGFADNALSEINQHKLLSAGVQEEYTEQAEKYNSEVKERNKAAFDNAVKNNGSVKLKDVVGKNIADKINDIENRLKEDGLTLSEVFDKMENPKTKEQFAEELKQSRDEHINKLNEKFDPEKNTGKIDLNLMDDADNVYEDKTIDIKAENLAYKEKIKFESTVGEDTLRDIKTLKSNVERMGLDLKSVLEFKASIPKLDANQINEAANKLDDNNFINDMKGFVNNADKGAQPKQEELVQNKIIGDVIYKPEELAKEQPKQEAPKQDGEEWFLQASDETVDKRVSNFSEKAQSTQGTVSFANEEASYQLYLLRGHVEQKSLTDDELRYALATVMLGDFSNSPTGKNMLNSMDDQVKDLEDYRAAAKVVAESESFKKALPKELTGKYLNSFLVDGKAGAVLGSQFSNNYSKKIKENKENFADDAVQEFAKIKAEEQKKKIMG